MFKNIKIDTIIVGVLLFISITLVSVNSVSASTLNLGDGTYRFRGFWADFDDGDQITFIAGYGLNQYSGLGIKLIASPNSKQGIIDFEYQFIPETMQNQQDEFNYAFKFGGANATIFEEEIAVKTGFIIENNFDYYDLYFDTNLYLQGLTMQIDDLLTNIELGITRELMPGVNLLFGYKAWLTPSDTEDIIHGAKYGVELNF